MAMSLAELTIPIMKEVGATCGFTLVRNSCIVCKIVCNSYTVAAARELQPGDFILRVNGCPVTEDNIRDVLRECRDMSEMSVTVARPSTKFTEQEAHWADSENERRNFCGCFGRKTKLMYSNNHESSNNPMSSGVVVSAELSRISYQVERRQSSTLSRLGSINSLSSGGMRPVDIRKLTKEGAGTMWKADRSASINSTVL